MEQKHQTRWLAIIAVIIAFNVALSYVVKIPVPATNGFVNLVEAGIFVAAMLGGAKSGMIVGGLSGLLLDLFAGYPQWMFFSLIIHGLEGLVVGSNIMVIGYMLAGTLLYNWTAGVASIIGNVAQAVMGLIVALILMPIFKRLPQINLK
ncbi:ECF transporter S component [Leuconostoc citreum]